jgi:hypothetical protein
MPRLKQPVKPLTGTKTLKTLSKPLQGIGQFYSLRDMSEHSIMVQKLKTPSVPDYAVPMKKFTDQSSGGLTDAIIFFLNEVYPLLYKRKAFVWRQGSEGRYRPGEVLTEGLWGTKKQMPGKWLPGLTNGIGDIMGAINGQAVAIEVKIRTDTQKKAQAKFQANFERGGGIYVIARTWEQWIEIFLKLFSSKLVEK